MTKSQKLAIRSSEIRTRLNAIAAMPVADVTDEIRTEADTLRAESATVETQYRAALVGEQAELDAGAAGAGEAAEFRALRGRVRMGEYMRAAVEMRSAGGAEAELNQHLGLGGTEFPLSLLAPPGAEHRATTDTDTTTMPVRWLDRLFADTAAMRVGVTMEAVAAGVASHPVTTAGAAAAQRGRAEAAADAAWTIGVTELKPARAAVRAVFTIEDAARLPGLEDALVRDLRMALTEGVDRTIFVGDDGANEAAGDIAGLTTAAIAEIAITQANKVKGPETLTAFTGLVDGIHAGGLADLRTVAAIGAWRLWETTIINSAAENQTLAAFMRAAGLTWGSRGEIETATTAGKFGAFVGLGRGIEGAAVAAVWEAGQLIRDPYTNAAKGEVALTLCYLWNFAVVRATNFKRIKFS